MKHDRKLDTAIDAVTEYIAVSAGAIDITEGIVGLNKDIDAAENILIILLRVKATLNKIEADASNGGPAESIRDLLDTTP